MLVAEPSEASRRRVPDEESGYRISVVVRAMVLAIGCYLPPAACRLPPAARLLPAARRLLPAARCLLPAARCPLPAGSLRCVGMSSHVSHLAALRWLGNGKYVCVNQTCRMDGWMC